MDFKRARKARINMDSLVTRISEDYSVKKAESPTTSQASFKSTETLTLDDDPFDYEIVNIDKSLLSLSEALSCELL